MIRRLLFGIAIFTTFTTFAFNSAYATTASVTASGNEGAIPLNVSGSFTSYHHCDDQEPPECWDINSGVLHVYHNGSWIGSASGNGSANWSTTLDGGSMSQGDHTYTATATDSEGVSSSGTATITIDNTPSVTVASPGQPEGEFDFSGTASFKERTSGGDGYVKIYIDDIYQGSSGWFDGENVSWSFSVIFGHMLDAGSFSQGEHTIKIRVYAQNGAEGEAAITTFTIDNTPSATVASPGQPEGAFDITGTASFKERTSGGDGYVKIYIDNIYQGSSGCFDGENVTWSFSVIFGHMLDAGSFSQGEHTIKIRVYAQNGAEGEPAIATFEITDLEKDKNKGDCNCSASKSCPLEGNPINIATGNQFKKETDLALGGLGLPLIYTRFYNSQHDEQGVLGYGWTGSFSEHLELTGGKIILHQADAAANHFHDDGQGIYISEADKVRIITTDGRARWKETQF